jgi:hypothetical protein
VTLIGARTRCDFLWGQAGTTFLRAVSGAATSRKRESREPSQLLLASLLYLHRALVGLNGVSLHKKVRGNPGGFRPIVRHHGYPRGDRHHVLATMHLASAAFRLTTALVLALRTGPDTNFTENSSA